MAWIHIHRQNKIAKIFTIFYNLKKFCDQSKLKLNLRKLKFKLTFFLVVVLFQIIFNFNDFLFNESGSKWSEKINRFLINNAAVYFFCLFLFIYFILIHCDFLLKNVSEILKNKLDHTHNECQVVLNNLILIQEMFEQVRKSFEITIFLYAIFQLGIISRIVSIAFILIFFKIH